MKKTMKCFAMLLGIVALGMASACSKDNFADLIVGKWSMVGGEGVERYHFVWDFHKDGVFTEVVTYREGGYGESEASTWQGIYSISEDIICLQRSYAKEYKILELTKNKLYVEPIGDDYQIIFEKI